MGEFFNILQTHRDAPLAACLATYDLFSSSYPARIYGTTIQSEFMTRLYPFQAA